MQDLYRNLRKELMARLALAGEVSDKQIKEIITELVIDAGKERYMTLEARSDISKELFYSVRKLDVLQDLIDDRQVTEIMVNGPDCIFVERAGKLTRVKSRFSSPEKLDDVIQQIVGKVNRVVNESSPIVDARLPDGSRVNVVTAPVALEGPILTIRRFPEVPITMDKLISYGSITGEAAAFLETIVRAQYSIIIGGGTSSGKTTFLNALSNFIPKTERIITIEDNAELQIQGVENLVRMEAKQANMEGNAEITIRDLVKSSLRMRPDRIIVGSETFPYELPRNWARVKRFPNVNGDFMWAAWAYLGEAGAGSWAYTPEEAGFSKPWPWLLAGSGALDIFGQPNAHAALAAAVWDATANPIIMVRPVNRMSGLTYKAT